MSFEKLREKKEEINQAVTHNLSKTDLGNQVIIENFFSKSRSDYKKAMDSANYPIFIFDGSGRIVDTNYRACEMFGRSYDNLINSSSKDIFPDDDLSYHCTLLSNGWANISTIKHENSLEEKSLLEIDITRLLDETSGKNQYLLAVIRDVSGTGRDIT